MAGLALVTGGGGFVGRHLVRLLVETGWPVRVLDPSPTVGAANWVRGSILEPRDLEHAFDDVEVVFHLAAETRLGVPDVGRYRRINVDGTAAVLAMAEARGVRRVVVTSTAAMLRGWNDPGAAPITSDDPRPEPRALAGPYTRAKLEAERLVVEAARRGLSVHLVYPTVPVGPGDPTPTPPTAMLRLFATRPPPLYLDGSLNLVDVADVALAHLRAADARALVGRHLVAGTDLEMAELLALVGRHTGRRMPRRTVPWRVALAAAAVEERIARLRGHVPTASVEGVRLVRHRRRHDASADLARLGVAPRPVEPAIRAALAG